MNTWGSQATQDPEHLSKWTSSRLFVRGFTTYFWPIMAKKKANLQRFKKQLLVIIDFWRGKLFYLKYINTGLLIWFMGKETTPSFFMSSLSIQSSHFPNQEYELRWPHLFQRHRLAFEIERKWSAELNSSCAHKLMALFRSFSRSLGNP